MPELLQISFIIPLYNEEEVFNDLILRLSEVLNSLNYRSEVVLIDDGSSDKTPQLMEETGLKDSRFSCLFLSRNFGHQLALSAGLQHARGTLGALILDGDLQDPPELIHDFIRKYNEGYDVIYAIRQNRKENWLLKLLYKLYYRWLKKMSNISIPIDSGDFAFVSRRVIDTINSMPEKSRFIRGMRAWVGYRQIGLEYSRDKRHSGSSKYTLKSLISLGLNGIYNFSEIPIRFISKIGIGAVSLSLIYLIFIISQRLLYGDIPEGFTTLVFLITLFSGVQLISIGVIGEYLVRIFFQTKDRPLYVISRIIREGKDE